MNRISRKPLQPLEPRGYWPGDCPISHEQLAQHTYIDRLAGSEHEDAVRLFLQHPPQQPIVGRQPEPINWRDAAAIAASASIIVACGWGLVVVLRWIGEVIGL